MAGFFKGVLAGLAVAAAGFLAFAVLVPPDPTPRDDAPGAPPAEAAPSVTGDDAAAEPADTTLEDRPGEPESDLAPAPEATPADQEPDSPEAPMDSAEPDAGPSDDSAAVMEVPAATAAEEITTEAVPELEAKALADALSQAAESLPEPVESSPAAPEGADIDGGPADATVVDDEAVAHVTTAPEPESLPEAHARVTDRAEGEADAVPLDRAAEAEAIGASAAPISPTPEATLSGTLADDAETADDAISAAVAPDRTPAQMPDPDVASPSAAPALAAERGATAAGDLPELAEAAPGEGREGAVPADGVASGDAAIVAHRTTDETSVAAPDPDAAPLPTAEAANALPQDADAGALPAWQRHAAAFEASAGRALYAVILIDAPADPRAEAALMALTVPVTVALDPGDPDAPRRARAYRSAGHEVAILAPEAPAEEAGPEDVAASAAQQAALFEAVGWLAPPANTWPTGQRIRASAAADAAGLALVLRDGAPMRARLAGASRARVIATVDPDLATFAEVLDLLDRAAATAADGAEVVVILGHASHPQMLEALIRRAGRESSAPAAPAPLSAALAAAR